MKKTFIVLTCLAYNIAGHSQTTQQAPDSVLADPDLSKVVHVVTEYEPSITDAPRINTLPKIEDTMQVKPKFTFAIVSKPIHPIFEVTPINAAKMKGEPLIRLYRGLFTGGFGNYTTTYADLQLNSLRSKIYELGSEFKHLGSFAKMKVGDEKEPAQYTTNFAKISGKRFLDKKEIYGLTNFRYDGFHLYGKPESSTVVFSKKDIARNYSYVNLDGGIRSLLLDSGNLNFDINPHFDFFNSNIHGNEIMAGLNNSVDKSFGDKSIGAELNINYYNSNIMSTNIEFNPWFGFERETFKIKVGLKTEMYTGDVEMERIYPDIYADYSLADKTVIPYIACNGYSQWYGLTKLIDENPFISDNLIAKPTDNLINVTGGFKGSMTKYTPYNISATYSRIEDMHMYSYRNIKNNSTDAYTFNLVDDNADVVNIHGEFGYKKLDKISLALKLDYFNYKLEKEEYAWFKPNFTSSLNFMYNIQKKIVTTIDLFYIGDRKAEDVNLKTPTLKGFFDANFGIDYRYTKRLSIFMNFNNIAAQKYQYWNYYPVQRFSLLFGFSYAFWGE